ncbi:hypothetical protein CLAFUW4_10558 [Fulvia fulva]|nr:hypothetical protein CLAFUR4_10563 [Fulvia fulva]WPV18740.1 hypothetical protein CLAFUW4_10558 [Fulvia fulva]WPV33980.1 hypothetical protein CLAFUW7_10560 [Fulvia fulva]
MCHALDTMVSQKAKDPRKCQPLATVTTREDTYADEWNDAPSPNQEAEKMVRSNLLLRLLETGNSCRKTTSREAELSAQDGQAGQASDAVELALGVQLPPGVSLYRKNMPIRNSVSQEIDSKGHK